MPASARRFPGPRARAGGLGPALALALALAVSCAPAPTPEAPFDPAAAWGEFDLGLREAYAYLDREDLDVEAHLARTRAAALATTDPAAFRRVLHHGTFAFTDPHLLVGPVEEADPNVWPTSGDLAIAVEEEGHGEGFRVADVRAGSAADAQGVRPGWRVHAVDGQPLEAAVAALAGVPAPTARQRAYAATLAVNGRRDGAARVLEVDDGAGRRSLTLENPRAYAQQVALRAPLTVELRDRVGIVRFENSLGRLETIAAFDAALARCMDLDGLVIDLRNTPSGGNTDVARAVIGHFLDEARPYQVHEVPAVLRRTTVPRRFVEYALPRAPRFPGHLAVLGGRWTGSMGEGLVIGLHAAAGARTFTSDMGDLLGALHTIDLPLSGATLELGAEALFHVDGTPRADFVGDVPLASADRDGDGGDPALDAALRWMGGGQ